MKIDRFIGSPYIEKEEFLKLFNEHDLFSYFGDENYFSYSNLSYLSLLLLSLIKKETVSLPDKKTGEEIYKELESNLDQVEDHLLDIAYILAKTPFNPLTPFSEIPRMSKIDFFKKRNICKENLIKYLKDPNVLDLARVFANL